jgi:CBS domain-containing membrane protein
VNSCILVGLGLLFHKLLSKRSYPHVAAPAPANTHKTADLPPQARVGFREAFDIDRADLGRLLRQVELQASIRSHQDLLCEDIMSRDVIAIGPHTSRDEALALLLEHNIRTLPVREDDGRLLGTVGLRELLQGTGDIRTLKSSAATAHAGDPAMSLLPVLTDGQTHAVIVVDAGGHVQGLISQTDLMSAVARSLAEKDSVAV